MREQYVMFKEFCEICDICPTTGRKAIAKKKVSYRKCQEGKLHYYEIPMSEVLRYKREREERGLLTDAEVEVRRNYYRRKMKDYPELINAADINTTHLYMPIGPTGRIMASFSPRSFAWRICIAIS